LEQVASGGEPDQQSDYVLDKKQIRATSGEKRWGSIGKESKIACGQSEPSVPSVWVAGWMVR
jgi:hypothetical protein